MIAAGIEACEHLSSIWDPQGKGSRKAGRRFVFVGGWRGAWRRISAPTFKGRRLLARRWLLDPAQLSHVAPIRMF